MQLSTCKYTKSAEKFKDMPTSDSEIAFVGRSNAGKSSAINKITNVSSLAKISKTPGRTRLINFFSIGDSDKFLVDLPGYGFAKVPIAMKKKWEQTLSNYLENRKELKGVILAMDIRHPMTDSDEKLIKWLSFYKLPIHILLTKSDKISFGAAKTTMIKVQRQLNFIEDGNITIQTFSSLKSSGVENAREVVNKWLEIQKKTPEKEAK